MSAPLRFLAFVAVGWIGFRLGALDLMPEAAALTVNPAPQRPDPPPATATEAPVSYPQPVAEGYGGWYPPTADASAGGYPQPHEAASPAYYPVPFYVPVAASGGRGAAFRADPITFRNAALIPAAAPLNSAFPELDGWPMSRESLGSYSALPAMPSAARPALPLPAAAAHPPRLDRVQLTMWTLLRNRPGPGSLAAGGQLGGSQAGARLSYNFNRWLALSLRSSAPVGSARGGEVAGGIRVIPFAGLPLAITAERRQALGKFSTGRSAFAVFAEGGLYRRPMPLDLTLDAYAQAGVVGVRSRDLFADGAVALTRPLLGPISLGRGRSVGRISIGAGLWGGVQPGLYRVDAGPRLSVEVRRNIRVHLDWRQRLAGGAEPGSGPALTLAGDF